MATLAVTVAITVVAVFITVTVAAVFHMLTPVTATTNGRVWLIPPPPLPYMVNKVPGGQLEHWEWLIDLFEKEVYQPFLPFWSSDHHSHQP